MDEHLLTELQDHLNNEYKVLERFNTEVQRLTVSDIKKEKSIDDIRTESLEVITSYIADEYFLSDEELDFVEKRVKSLISKANPEELLDLTI